MSQGFNTEVKDTDTSVDSLPPIIPLFRLGQLHGTPSALGLLSEHNIQPSVLLWRHVCGDWGTVCQEDRQANEEAVFHGLRILSVYKIKTHDIWVITEADRSITTILLPEEY